MKLKTKLIVSIVSMCLVISVALIGIFAASAVNMKISGDIIFNAQGISFSVGEGNFYESDGTTPYTGITTQTNKLLEFSMNTNTTLTSIQSQLDSWKSLALKLDQRGDAILKFNVSNDMTDKVLYLVFDISMQTNKNNNVVITTSMLQEIEAEQDKDIEIKFDILDMELNADVDNFKIDIYFTDVFEATSGTISNLSATGLTNAKYAVTNATNKTLSVAPQSTDIVGNVIIPHTIHISGVPYTVTSILEFSGCDDMTGIYIPGTITTIGNDYFDTCASLMTLQLAEGVTTLEPYAFNECSMISGELILPDSLVTIGQSAFSMCGEESRLSLKLGANVETIGDHAFTTQGLVGELVIPSKVKTIGNYAFAGVHVSSIYIPKSVISIGVAPFSGTSATSITVEAGNTKYYSAGNCLIETSTKKLIQGLSTSVIPDEVTAIGDEAFRLVNITSLHIPKNVSTIASNAFYATRQLETITVDSANTKYIGEGNCLIERSTGKLILGCIFSVIPNDGTVKIIGERAFYNSEIIKLTLPTSVTKIEANAFDVCRYLTLTIESTTPPTLGANALGAINTIYAITIYVPAASVNTYKTAWSNYANKIFAI